MKAEEAKKQFPVEFGAYKNNEIVNPIEMFERYYFNNGTNYREAAYKRCLEEEVDFATTLNTTRTALNDIVSVRCPKCGGETKWFRSAGNMNTETSEHECQKCGVIVSLTVVAEGAIAVTFRKK